MGVRGTSETRLRDRGDSLWTGGGSTHVPSAQPEGDQELGLWSWERQKPAQGSETSESVSRGNPTARQPSWVECDQPPAREPQPPAEFAPVRQASAHNPRRRAQAPLPSKWVRIRLRDRTEHRGCGLGERLGRLFHASLPDRTRRLHSPLRPRETLALPPGGASAVPGPSAQARGGDA